MNKLWVVGATACVAGLSAFLGWSCTAQPPMAAPSAVGEIRSMQDFQSDVLASDQPVLVEFYASWCIHCMAMSPTIGSLKTEYEGKAKVVKVEIGQGSEVADQYNIRNVPTVIVFKKGQPAARFVGEQNVNVYRAALDAARG